MRKLNRKMRQSIAKKLVSFLVVAIFILPGLFTARWAIKAFASGDSRDVVDVAVLQARDADKNTTPLKPFEEPIISVTFDDGWETIYTAGLPIMQKYGIRSTQYVMSGVFENTSYMSINQIKSMQTAGHEVGSHTIDHKDLTQLDETQLNKQLKESKDILTKNFGPIKDFTSPYGAYNAHTLETIGKYYRTQKNAEGDPAANELEAINISASFKPLNFVSYSVRETTTLYEITKLIEAAKKHNGWLVLTYHQIDRSGDEFSVNPEEFESQMALLFNTNVRSATVGQVVDTWQKGNK